MLLTAWCVSRLCSSMICIRSSRKAVGGAGLRLGMPSGRWSLHFSHHNVSSLSVMWCCAKCNLVACNRADVIPLGGLPRCKYRKLQLQVNMRCTACPAAGRQLPRNSAAEYGMLLSGSPLVQHEYLKLHSSMLPLTQAVQLEQRLPFARGCWTSAVHSVSHVICLITNVRQVVLHMPPGLQWHARAFCWVAELLHRHRTGPHCLRSSQCTPCR
jgi:hypothetical protein